MLPYVIWATVLTLAFTLLLLQVKKRTNLSATHVVSGSLLSLTLSICFPAGLLFLSPIAAGAVLLAVVLLAAVILQPVIESGRLRLTWVENFSLPCGLIRQLFLTHGLKGFKHVRGILTRIAVKPSPARRATDIPAKTEAAADATGSSASAALPGGVEEPPEVRPESFRTIEEPSEAEMTANAMYSTASAALPEAAQANDRDEADKGELTVRAIDPGREFTVMENTTMPTQRQLKSLNELINGGFDAKEQGRWEEAVSLFRQGLEVSRSPDLSLLLVLEISCLYRDNGCYQQAIEVLSSFLNLYREILNTSQRAKLQHELFYIETVYHLLQQSGTPDLPSSRVPRLIKLKAEELFRQRKSIAL